MNVLFITVSNVNIANHGIYSDLMRYFVKQGHNLYIVSPVERRQHKPTEYVVENGVHCLYVKTLNIQKTNFLEKGISTILLERQYCNAIKHYMKGTTFDLLLYSTPPITFCKVISYIKSTNPNIVSYLLIKDIFPQNSVDLGMIKHGSVLYKYFRRKEKTLYRLSDFIGCMSPANVQYLLEHNPYLSGNNVEIAPNSVELEQTTPLDRTAILSQYNLPQDKTLFVYGGNLGKPQGISFLIQCLQACANKAVCHFIVVGNGTEYGKLEQWYKQSAPGNVTLLKQLPKADYDHLIRACHVGLLFLDYRFTIPNYPSRLLPYLQYKLPVIAATDPNSDIGTIAQANGYGLACPSNDVKAFTECVDRMLQSDCKLMGEKGYQYLKEHYSIECTYNAIMKHLDHV